MTQKINIQPQRIVITSVILLSFLCLNFMPSQIQVYPNLQVIVNKDVNVSRLTKNEFEKIIHGEQLRWPDGKSSISIVYISPHQPIGNEMREKMFNMSLREFNDFWIEQEFAGHLMSSPITKFYEEDVIDYVARIPGAIGVISADTKSDLVKTVTITNDEN